ncbi:MAG: DUF4855 domain-containing protein [Eubacteriales bacterium]|nr:DUF4855 domain-containing protein [Eubacteriales bacterium]MDD4475765.1 DUF4855 domain-containing protein [Eubacteriales bacterium]
MAIKINQKKFFALLMAGLILLGTVSCTNTPGSNSDTSDKLVSGENSQGDESVTDPVFNDPNYIQPKYPIDDFLKDAVVREGERKLLSLGKSYTSDFPSDTANYHDTDLKELTDGVRGPLNFLDKSWAGFEQKGNSTVSITIDMGEQTDGISDIEFSALSMKDVGITVPSYVKFSVSNDNQNYHDIGTVYMTGNNTGLYSESYILKLNKSISVRYVRVFVPKESWWLFVDEFAVYAYDEKPDETKPDYGDLGKKLYTNEKITKVTTEVFWDKNESDYDKQINLVKGITQKVYVPLPLSDRYFTDYKNSLADSKVLTDGKKETNIWSENWFKSVHGIERNLVFDLQKTSTVSELNLGFAQSLDSGVYLPRLVEIYLSDNGEDWQLVHERGPITGAPDGRYELNIKLDKNYKARFVNVKLGVSCFMFCDEIEVIGTKKVDSSSISLKPTGSYETKFPGDYIRPDDSIYGGAQHILLAPFLKDASAVAGEITKEYWLPYMAYLDKSGKIVDTMFDAVMMGEYGTIFEKGKNASALKNYIESLFTDGANLDALDEVIDEIKTALNLKDYKISVTVSLPSFNRGFINQDYNGDGKSEDLTTLEGLKTVTDWMMTQIEAKFKAAGYKNLVLHGYYWTSEGIEYQKPFEAELIEYTAAKCKEKGFLLSWIPWNNASGYQEWDKLGFDVTSMQPNYAWYSLPKEVVGEIAESTKLLGMSVEMEIHPAAPFSKQYFDNYMEYLKGGITYGYMNAINFYYQGGMPGEYFNGLNSDGVYGRAIYDYTYKYIKGTLKIEEVESASQTINMYTNKIHKGNLNTGAKENTFYQLETSPTYGTIKLSTDGEFTYTPAKDFEGNDSFTYTVYNGFSESTNVQVTIKVRISN